MPIRCWTDGLQLQHPPSRSHSYTADGIASRWWEGAAQQVLGTSRNPAEIELIRKYIPVRHLREEPLLGQWSDSHNLFPSPGLTSLLDATDIAKRFDVGVCSAFRQIPFHSWVKYELGYGDAMVSGLLKGVSNSRRDLTLYFRESHQPKDRWKLIKEASVHRSCLR
jgi:hypothetical protein